MKDSAIVAIFGLGCATALGVACILGGIDSVIIAGVSMAIASIVGYACGVRRKCQ